MDTTIAVFDTTICIFYIFLARKKFRTWTAFKLLGVKYTQMRRVIISE